MASRDSSAAPRYGQRWTHGHNKGLGERQEDQEQGSRPPHHGAHCFAVDLASEKDVDVEDLKDKLLDEALG